MLSENFSIEFHCCTSQYSLGLFLIAPLFSNRLELRYLLYMLSLTVQTQRLCVNVCVCFFKNRTKYMLPKSLEHDFLAFIGVLF